MAEVDTALGVEPVSEEDTSFEEDTSLEEDIDHRRNDNLGGRCHDGTNSKSHQHDRKPPAAGANRVADEVGRERTGPTGEGPHRAMITRVAGLSTAVAERT